MANKECNSLGGVVGEGIAVVLAAHGSSRDQRINRPMFELARQIADTADFSLVTPAFLDGQPDLRTIMNEIADRRAVVIPFMASAGYYTDVVFPNSFADTNVEIRITEPIGNHPRLPEMVGQRIENVLDRFDGRETWTIVVVGHGTRKNRKSCRTAIELVQALRTRIGRHAIPFAFIDQNPSLEHVAAGLTSSHVLIVPFLMGLGPHLTVDVPTAFGLGCITDDVFETDFRFPLVRTIEPRCGNPLTVVFDAPIGVYPEWTDICLELAVNEAKQFQWPPEVSG